jgi:hypothetical protein
MAAKYLTAWARERVGDLTEDTDAAEHLTAWARERARDLTGGTDGR